MLEVVLMSVLHNNITFNVYISDAFYPSLRRVSSSGGGGIQELSKGGGVVTILGRIHLYVKHKYISILYI